MTREIYRFEFGKDTPAQEIEETLNLAIIAAECLHGQSRVRLDASYCMDENSGVCVIDPGSDAGQDIVRIFTGLAIRTFGEDAFKVRRMERKSKPQAAEASV